LHLTVDIRQAGRLTKDKHTSLFDLFVSDKNKVSLSPRVGLWLSDWLIGSTGGSGQGHGHEVLLTPIW